MFQNNIDLLAFVHRKRKKNKQTIWLIKIKEKSSSLLFFGCVQLYDLEYFRFLQLLAIIHDLLL